MEKDRKELRKLLQDALEGLGEKEELVERLSKIEKKLEKLDALDKKLDKIIKALEKPAKVRDPLEDLLEKIEREKAGKPWGNPPWSTPPNWPPYRATFDSCSMGGEHEYPSDWACILPASCKKCGKTAPNLYGTATGKGWQDGLQSWHATSSELYLDDPSPRLKLSDSTHEALNNPVVPEGASIVSNDRVTTSEGPSLARRHFGLTAKPRDKNNAYWKM